MLARDMGEGARPDPSGSAMSPTAQTRLLETERRSGPVRHPLRPGLAPCRPPGPARPAAAPFRPPAADGCRRSACRRPAPRPRRRAAGLSAPAARRDRHALRGSTPSAQQGWRNALDQFLVLARRDARRRLDHRHQAAEPGMRLGHLDPDRPAAEDQQVAGRLRQVEQRLVGQPGHAVEPRQVGDHRAAAGGDDGAAEGEAAAAGLDLVRAR